MTTDEGLLAAVNNLTNVVKALEKTIREDYPKRAEIEHKFATKKESRSRRNAFIGALVLGLIGSFFVTFSTLSYCFLGGTEQGAPGRVACSVMPGYQSAVDSNNELLKEFFRIRARMDDNAKRIRKLERAQQ